MDTKGFFLILLSKPVTLRVIQLQVDNTSSSFVDPTYIVNIIITII